MKKITLIKKFFSSLFFLLIAFFTFSHSFINASSVKIIKPNRKSTKSTESSFFSFHPLNVVFKYPYLIQSSNIKIIKKHLSNISILFGRLIYTKNYKSKLKYNKDLLRRLKIKLSEKEEKAFEEKEIKADLLLVVKFLPYNKMVASHDLYTKNDEDDSANSRRTYMALLKINKNYNFTSSDSEMIFKIKIIREILKILGFRKDLLKQFFIRNNFDEIPTYLIGNSKAFQSYKKYLNLTDKQFIGNRFTPDTRFYKHYWDDSFDIHDIMTQTIYNDLAFTELTINLMNEFSMYTINQCDIFKYQAGFGKGYSCVRPAQDCIDIKNLNNFFLEYNIYKDYNIKCYLNTKENILNKQCGTIYGNLVNKKLEYRFCPSYKQIRDTSLYLSMTAIPELDVYPFQKLRLIKKSKFCPKNTPRAIFFSVPPSIFDEFKNHINVTDLIDSINEIKMFNMMKLQ